jgi:hypothetical protein
MKTPEKHRRHCSLDVLFARSAPIGVILRRGPTRWVQLIKWNTATDQFHPGQWFHGKIYARRSDLCPDGSLLIYFAQKITGRTLVDKEYTYAWTAISKPPYFTALALWPKGDCWHGGGVFQTARRVWLNHKPEVAIPHPRHRPRRLQIVSNQDAQGEDWPVWSKRMTLDGWTLVQPGRFVIRRGSWVTEQVEIWRRPHATERLVLSRQTDAISSRRGFIETFRLVTLTGAFPLRDVNWADWDQNGRLVFTRGGKLFIGTIAPDRIVESELADFTDQEPTNFPTPPWARSWHRGRLGRL